MSVKMSTAPSEVHLSLREKWKYANFTHNYVFGVILKENPEITKRIIELAVPDIEIDDIVYIEREVNQQPSPLSKLTRLDIEVRLRSGKIIMVEMQVARKKDFPKRLRVYRSERNMEIMKPGLDYDQLPDMIQIAVCCFDPFNKDRFVYDYEVMERETHEASSENGERVVYLNAKGHIGDISDELRGFPDYVGGRKSDGELAKQIDDKVNQLKYDAAREDEFMKVEDWISDQKYLAYQEGSEDGRKEGRKEERAEGVLKAYDLALKYGADPQRALNDIAEEYGMSVSEVREIISSKHPEAAS